ncbi:hypothetical protein SF83666_b59120 (plasmid) [Sinorhizobium fredii CCBAU 83666]|nr:hypothetical protein SF83666_b59120 [Sinorhizobium fredii CCBAU 83666]
MALTFVQFLQVCRAHPASGYARATEQARPCKGAGLPRIARERIRNIAAVRHTAKPRSK